MDISILIPVQNEEKNLAILARAIKSVMNSLNFSYEVIFVDDGSKDHTFEVLTHIHEKNKNFKVIKLRRHFGKTPALVAALNQSKGDIIITMDGDLQDDPREIPRFIEKLKQGYDLVSGWKFKRKDPILSKKIFSRIYNWLSRRLTNVPLHDMNCGFKAYRSEALKNIKLYGEMHRYIPIFFVAKGYKIGEIKVLHHKRRFGKSKYGFRRIFIGSFDLLFMKFWMDYSTKPLHVFGSLGVTCFMISFLIFAYNLLRYGIFLTIGPSLLFSGIILIMGIQFIVLGILGEMLTRIYYDKTDNKIYKIEKVLK